jgi:thiol-disulfide isomerase/thioredoxin
MAVTVCAQTNPSGSTATTIASSSDGLNALKKAKDDLIAKLIPLNETSRTLERDLSAAIKEGKDEATINSLKAKQENLSKEIQPIRIKYSQIEKQILEQYPSSVEAANVLMTSVGRMPVSEGLAKYELLSLEAKNSTAGKYIKDKLDGMRSGSPGAIAPDFTATELKGGTLSLSDYRGKFVLIDFWASWCVPCRKGNPHLLDLYAKYKDKGFEIIGVASDDGAEDKWKAAVEQDKIGVWKHVLTGHSREKSVSGEIAIGKKYGISTLPTKILVDPSGKVIGRYGSGGENNAALDKKLLELFN